MNNNMRFDPMTGQLLDTNNNTSTNDVNINSTQQAIQPTASIPNVIQSVPNVQASIQNNDVQTSSQVNIPNTMQSINPVQQNIQSNGTQYNNQQIQTIDPIMTTQQQMQNIPTVEQNRQDFINNTQANSSVNIKEKKNGPNIIFIVIIFVIIFASIFFLFPYLLENL